MSLLLSVLGVVASQGHKALFGNLLRHVSWVGLIHLNFLDLAQTYKFLPWGKKLLTGCYSFLQVQWPFTVALHAAPSFSMKLGRKAGIKRAWGTLWESHQRCFVGAFFYSIQQKCFFFLVALPKTWRTIPNWWYHFYQHNKCTFFTKYFSLVLGSMFITRGIFWWKKH